MTSLLEKTATTVLVVAAVAVAAATLHREFGRDERHVSRITPRQIDSISIGGHRIGESSAPIRVVVFTDVECPFCAKFHKTIMVALAERPSDFFVSYHHYPLERHQSARRGAEALICADMQGRFEPMLSTLFASQEMLSKRDSTDIQAWLADADRAGITDTNAFRRCLIQHGDNDAISRDRSIADDLGLEATPMVVIGNKKYSGALDEQRFNAELSHEIEQRARPALLRRISDWFTY